VKLRTAVLLVLLGSITVVAAPARAGGMDWPDNGVQAMGRSGAFVAKADDLSAVVHNVAGLTQIKGFNLLLDNNVMKQNLCFDRAGSYPGTPAPYSFSGQPFPKVCRMLDGMFYIPMLAGSYDFGLKNWTFAFAGYGPHAVDRRRWPMQVTVEDSLGQPVQAPGPSRYDTERQEITVIFFTFAAAYRPVRWLSVGAAFQVAYSEVQYATWVPLTPGMDPDSDIRFQIRTRGVAYTGILSTLLNPVAGLHLGLSVRLPVHAVTSGEAWLKLPPSAAMVGSAIEWAPGQDRASMATDLPLVVRSGLRYAWPMKGHPGAPDLGDVELDLVWERWSSIKTMDTQLNATLLGEPMAKFALNHFYQDVIEYRLGGSFTVPRTLGGGWLTLRAGWFYGNNASPKEYTRLNYDAWARLGLSFGLSYRIAGVDLRLAFSHAWSGDGEKWQPWSFRATRSVTASCVQPIDAFNPPVAVRCDPSTQPAAQDISRGTYRGSYTNVSLGFQIQFDEVARVAKAARRKQ
jgi:long-subunit fatty acid transport protein